MSQQERSEPSEIRSPAPVRRKGPHRRLYDWVLHWADSKHSGWALFILAFAESSFFPVPPDVLLAPMTLGARRKWWRFALSCSAASIVGGIFGYMIGLFLWSLVGNFFHSHVPGFGRDTVLFNSGTEIVGMIDPEQVDVKIPLMEATLKFPFAMADTNGQRRMVNQDDAETENIHIRPFTKCGSLYRTHDWKIVAIAGFTPLPYKVITITAGVFKINFLIFCIASALSRSARFFLVAGLFGHYGPKITPFIDRYFNWLCLLFGVLLIGGFLVLKWL